MKITELDSPVYCISFVALMLFTIVAVFQLISSGFIYFGISIITAFLFISIYELSKITEVFDCDNGSVLVVQKNIFKKVVNKFNCNKIKEFRYGGNGQGFYIILVDESMISISTSLELSIRIKDEIESICLKAIQKQ